MATRSEVSNGPDKELLAFSETLGKTYQWMQSWYKDFQRRSGLSEEAITKRFKDPGVSSPDILVQTRKDPVIYRLWDIALREETPYGPVSLMMFGLKVPDVIGEPEEIEIWTPVGNFSKAKRVSYRLADVDVIDITSVHLYSKDEKIVQVVQYAKQGIFFRDPNAEDGRDQVFNMRFYYENGTLTGWSAIVALCSDDVQLRLSSNGERQVSGKDYKKYNMPQKINAQNALKNIISQRPAVTP